MFEKTNYSDYLQDLATLLNDRAENEQEIKDLQAEYDKKIKDAEFDLGNTNQRVGALLNFLQIECKATNNIELETAINNLTSPTHLILVEPPIENDIQDKEEVESNNKQISVKAITPLNNKGMNFRDRVYVQLLLENIDKSYEPKEIQSWLDEKNYKVSGNFGNNICGRGRKKGFLQKIEGKYSLTEKGIEYARKLKDSRKGKNI